MSRYTSLGSQIRAARHAKGWTQEKLGEMLGCERQRIILWERGAHRPNRRYQQLLEVVLASTFDWSADVEPMTDQEAGAVERTERRIEEMVA